MPAGTRRSHNKTRLGCANCKKRRIKCDCTHPVCDNCKKRGQECSFLLLAPSSRLSTTLQPAPSTTPTGASPTSSELTLTSATSDDSQNEDIEIIHRTPPSASKFSRPSSTIALAGLGFPLTIPPYFRYDDVWKDAREKLSPGLQGLLYHYEYTTSLTLAPNDPAKSAWRSGIPELASRHQFLVHHIITVASLHLGRLHGRGTERSTMTNVAASQMNKALALYRPALENVTAENASALFASATLTAVYFFRTSTVEIDEIRDSVPAGTVEPSPEIADKMLQCVLRTIWGLRGPLAVLIPGFRFVMEGQMSPVLNRKWWPTSRIPRGAQAIEEDQRLAQIQNLWKHGQHLPSVAPTVDSLASALFYLREAYALVALLAEPDNDYPSNTCIAYSQDGRTEGNLKDRGAIFFWATQISRHFIRLLEQKNVAALVIVAHYAVLSGRVRNAWWLEGLGSNIVIGVAMALGEENWHLIEWPVRVLDIDLYNAFTARSDSADIGDVPMEII
ncbi:hypothetical protein P280DRAFT_509992 [Massarina eburnea CBS 473.64]|uniref:Zn(2)-C6 fungal-type domain-containing protein n=1 Tax=Massarina eburnea CBS 473.64 TaxID=1395130 RepID=A0A6A6RQX7_9PLEO|nr:hypothetical protein P280DRAFT_509992 [Massarina eburnea CBS 473.64]